MFGEFGIKQLTKLISVVFFLTLGVSQGWALPNCTGSYSISNDIRRFH